MQHKLVEATIGSLYLKAVIGRFDAADWSRSSLVAQEFDGSNIPLLQQEGHSHEHSYFILDLSKGTGGAIMSFGGNADHDIANAATIF